MATIADVVLGSAPLVLTGSFQTIPGPTLNLSHGEGRIFCLCEVQVLTPAVGAFALMLQIALNGVALTSRNTPLTTNLNQSVCLFFALPPRPGYAIYTFNARDTIDPGSTVNQNGSRFTILELPVWSFEAF